MVAAATPALKSRARGQVPRRQNRLPQQATAQVSPIQANGIGAALSRSAEIAKAPDGIRTRERIVRDPCSRTLRVILAGRWTATFGNREFNSTAPRARNQAASLFQPGGIIIEPPAWNQMVGWNGGHPGTPSSLGAPGHRGC